MICYILEVWVGGCVSVSVFQSRLTLSVFLSLANRFFRITFPPLLWVISRGHATPEFAASVGRSVCRFVTFLKFERFFAIRTAPAHPSTTGGSVYGLLFKIGIVHKDRIAQTWWLSSLFYFFSFPITPCGKNSSLVLLKQQVTRGQNIVADGWAGVPNPSPHLVR